MAVNLDNGRRILIFERHLLAIHDIGNKERLEFLDAIIEYAINGCVDLNSRSGLIRMLLPEIISMSSISEKKAENRRRKVLITEQTQDKSGTNTEQTQNKSGTNAEQTQDKSGTNTEQTQNKSGTNAEQTQNKSLQKRKSKSKEEKQQKDDDVVSIERCDYKSADCESDNLNRIPSLDVIMQAARICGWYSHMPDTPEDDMRVLVDQVRSELVMRGGNDNFGKPVRNWRSYFLRSLKELNFKKKIARAPDNVDVPVFRFNPDAI